MDHGVTINRPPRDGRMAFVRSPDNISIELLQRGEALPPMEPWTTLPNTGHGSAAQQRGRRRLNGSRTFPRRRGALTSTLRRDAMLVTGKSFHRTTGLDRRIG